MPNIQSAKKRVKVTAKKYAGNKAVSSALKTSVKKANVAIAENSQDKTDLVKSATRAIDRAVAKGIIHKNNAARKKSALTLKLNKS